MDESRGTESYDEKKEMDSEKGDSLGRKILKIGYKKNDGRKKGGGGKNMTRYMLFTKLI